MTYFPVTVTVCYLLVGQNMLRKMLEKVTKARCVWVSGFSSTFKSGEIRSTKKLIGHSCSWWLWYIVGFHSSNSKCIVVFQVGVNTFCIMAVALQLGHLLQVNINKALKTVKSQQKNGRWGVYSVTPFNLMWLQMWLQKLLGFCLS